MFLIEYYKDVVWQYLRNGEQIKSKLDETFKKIGVTLSGPNLDEILS